MRVVDCRRCGSKELIEEDGFIVCTYCQSKFVPQSDDLRPMESTIGIVSDIERLLTMCRAEPHNQRRYASLVLDMDPTNAEARRYL
jgi:hypothetical protein